MGAVQAKAALCADERRRISEALAADPLRGVILAEATKRSQRVRRYFEQEGLFDETPYAFVDTGWSGRTQEVLESLFAFWNSPRPLHGFYFWLGSWDGSCRGTLRSFLHNIRLPSDRAGGLRRVNTMLELLMAADHGCVLDYEEKAGRMEPVLSSSPAQRQDGWQIPAQQAVILEFVKACLQAGLDWSATEHWVVPVIASLLDELCTAPSESEARVYGSAFCSEDHAIDIGYRFAHAYSWREALGYVVSGRLRDRPTYTDWHEGSLRLTPRFRRLVILLLTILRTRFVESWNSRTAPRCR